MTACSIPAYDDYKLIKKMRKVEHVSVYENNCTHGDTILVVEKTKVEGSSVRGRAAATGETLWGRLPCNPTLTVRPAPLSETSLTALNCYL